MDIFTTSLIVAGAVLVLRFLIALVRKFTQGRPISGILIATIILTSIGLGMATYLAGSIKYTIDEQNMIADREELVIEHLGLIREAEIVYQEVNGKYTADWDSLINFIKYGEYPIIQRTEEIITLAYGADSVILHLDTLEMVPARERIFKANYTENAVDSGTFISYEVKNGDRAIKGLTAYTMKNPRGKTYEHVLHNNGVITSLADLNPGDKIQKGQNMITYWEYRFNPKINLDELGYVPGYEGRDKVRFTIFAGKIPVGVTGILVDVIEVKNPKPFDKTRSESNEAKNRKPLKFGSRTDITTSGNWE
ncbi:MAG: hypothetical protein OEX02_01740 [Cyclobacteriaceae bacterium]|nr:hypothetical protein [Cyclobacteriaceae bacterium]